MADICRPCQGAARCRCRSSQLDASGLDANRNYSLAHFQLAAAFARLGKLDEGRAAVNSGLALDPSFTIRRFRANAPSDNPIYLAGRERLVEGMRLAGVPEG